MDESFQLLIVAVVIVAAIVGLWLQFRRKSSCDKEGCDGCPLTDNCHKKALKKRDK